MKAVNDNTGCYKRVSRNFKGKSGISKRIIYAMKHAGGNVMYAY